MNLLAIQGSNEFAGSRKGDEAFYREQRAMYPLKRRTKNEGYTNPGQGHGSMVHKHQN